MSGLPTDSKVKFAVLHLMLTNFHLDDPSELLLMALPHKYSLGIVIVIIIFFAH